LVGRSSVIILMLYRIYSWRLHVAGNVEATSENGTIKSKSPQMRHCLL